MIKICPFVYISDLASAKNPELLKANNIKHVISLGCSLDPVACDIANNSCMSFPLLLDTPEQLILDVLLLTSKFMTDIINEQLQHGVDSAHPSNILVHCVYGQSRSATVILWLLITDLLAHHRQV